MSQVSLEGKPLPSGKLNKRICPLVRLPCLRGKCLFFEESCMLLEVLKNDYSRITAVVREGEDTTVG